MKKLFITIIALSIAAICVFGWLFLNSTKVVGKNIKEDDFKEFYWTRSSTAYPPEFQRYCIYTENGRKMFRHEKREGDTVFLTEEDITVAGEKELTPEEWKTFWDLISGGKVRNRRESVTAGGAGPWLYIYWNGDRDKCQEFKFADDAKKTEFEEFCVGLKEIALK